MHARMHPAYRRKRPGWVRLYLVYVADGEVNDPK